MKSRLRHELHRFLEQERISLESGIVNYLTYQLADIEVTQAQMQEGFYFASRWYQAEEKEKITFTIPEKFTIAQIEKLMTFFNLPKESYQHKQSLVLNDQHIFDVFLPKFKLLFQEIKEKSPASIVRYRLSSAALLESTAKNTLTKYIGETRKIVLLDNLKELTPNMKSLIDFILLLSGRMDALDRFPFFYKDILDSRNKLNEFLQLPEIKANKDLTTQLKMILEGIELYARYHRTESVLGNMAFYKQFTQFLVSYRISTAKCDILVHTVLALAGAEIYPNSSCKFIPGTGGHDSSRLILIFNDINQENADKVVDYMRHLGDETAHEGSGYRQYGSALASQECAIVGGGARPESALFSVGTVREGTPTTVREPEMHSIEVDGKFFYEHIFPRVKAQIEQMAAQNLLTKYQELSQDYFKPKETTPVSTVGLFSRPSSPVAVAFDDYAGEEMPLDFVHS